MDLVEEGETMPKRDGTGPCGNGPLTGQADGSCIVPLKTTEQELEFLKKREEALKKQLQYVREKRGRNMNKQDKQGKAVQ
jgi:hypothetical protein